MMQGLGWHARGMATVAAVVLLVGGDALARSGDAVRGERVFQRCYACHSVRPEEVNLPGPNLYELLGRPAAARPDVAYSEAMQAAGAAGVTWTEEMLDRYLADPDAMIPGTLMAVNGLREAQDRADVIAYIKAASAPAGEQ